MKGEGQSRSVFGIGPNGNNFSFVVMGSSLGILLMEFVRLGFLILSHTCDDIAFKAGRGTHHYSH